LSLEVILFIVLTTAAENLTKIGPFLLVALRICPLRAWWANKIVSLQVLLEIIPSESLPPHWGGSQTSPDTTLTDTQVSVAFTSVIVIKRIRAGVIRG
jgi:hypothetical protein